MKNGRLWTLESQDGKNILYGANICRYAKKHPGCRYALKIHTDIMLEIVVLIENVNKCNSMGIGISFCRCVFVIILVHNGQ